MEVKVHEIKVSNRLSFEKTIFSSKVSYSKDNPYKFLKKETFNQNKAKKDLLVNDFRSCI